MSKVANYVNYYTKIPLSPQTFNINQYINTFSSKKIKNIFHFHPCHFLDFHLTKIVPYTLKPIAIKAKNEVPITSKRRIF